MALSTLLAAWYILLLPKHLDDLLATAELNVAMPEVSPAVLKWARETAGLAIPEAARSLGITAARGQTPEQRLVGVETGAVAPTLPMLEKMSKKYHRSLLVFYFDAPPAPSDRGRDFRTVPGAQAAAYNPTLDAFIRDIRARQSIVASVLEQEDAAPRTFVGSASASSSPAALAADIEANLGFDLQLFRGQAGTRGAFKYLRTRIESLGVFVILAGNLGSHHSNIPPAEFRGYAIADPIAPFVIINDLDSDSAWSFTALHELCHIWFGATGISGSAPDTGIERLCNDVAGRILLPSTELTALGNLAGMPFDSVATAIAEFATARSLSRSMVAYKLFVSAVIGEDLWQRLAQRFHGEWVASKAQQKANRNPDGGPEYYVVRRDRLGPALTDLIGRSLDEGAMTGTSAARVLGVKPRSVYRLLREDPRRAVL